MLNETHANIITTLRQAKRVLLISHKKPDGDTIGSNLALAQFCATEHIPYYCYCVDTPADYMQFLPRANELGPNELVWSDPTIDVVVTVDCGDLKYAGVADKITLLPSTYTLINIDHHFTNPGYGDINLVDSTASSACEVVYHLLESVRAITHDIATCLLTGLITDTGSFSNLATTSSAVAAASALMAKGANLPQISKNALQHRPYSTLRLWGRALERLHEDSKTGMIVTALSLSDIRECEADEEAVSGISNFLNGLEQSAEKAILVLTQSQPGVIKGSLRTTNPLLDVTEFAKLYGGGGHKKAAGFTLNGTLEITPHGYTIHPA